MSAIAAALGRSFMMVLALAAFAWYAASSGRSRRHGREVDALRTEIPELRHQQPPASSDEVRGRR